MRRALLASLSTLLPLAEADPWRAVVFCDRPPRSVSGSPGLRCGATLKDHFGDCTPILPGGDAYTCFAMGGWTIVLVGAAVDLPVPGLDPCNGAAAGCWGVNAGLWGGRALGCLILVEAPGPDPVSACI